MIVAGDLSDEMIVAVAGSDFMSYFFHHPGKINETILMALPRCNQIEGAPDLIQRFVCEPFTEGFFVVVVGACVVVV